MTKAQLPVVKGATITEALDTVNGAAFASIDTLVEVKLTGGKSNPFQGRVTKSTVGNQVMVFTNKNSNGYDNMVKRRLEAEGKDPESFKLGALPWGTRIENTPFIQHNGELYLQLIYMKPGQSSFLVDGLPYAGEIPGLPAEKEPTGQGGLENQVIIRTLKEKSIKRLRFDHNEYVF
jgi:hypothetical protein